MQFSLYLFSNFILNHVFKHSKCIYLIDPLHLQGFKSGFLILFWEEQQILHIIYSDELDCDDSYSDFYSYYLISNAI